MNNVFRTAENITFEKVLEKDVKPEGNFITVREKKAVALMGGIEVPMPQVLYNEIGVGYYFVPSFYEHAKKMIRKHGAYVAKKQEGIRVWHQIKPGETIKTIIDGYEEHSIELDDTKVAAQNIIKNEFYAIPKEVLKQRYKFEHNEFDYDVYIPKSDTITLWAYSDANIFGVLFGGLEFLTTPMINFTNPDNCYGCNYVVWWGNDGRSSSYEVLGYFHASGQEYYESPMDDPISVREATYKIPKELDY